MKRIVFVKEETEEDYRLTIEAMENVIFSACMYHLQAIQKGNIPTSKEVEDIDYVRGLMEEMKLRLTE